MANYPELVKDLKEKGEVSFIVHGNSMTPKIKNGEKVTVSSDISDVKKGDVVFCKVKGTYYVHLVKAIKNGQWLIGNNHGHDNGWTSQVFGKVIHHE